MTLKIPNPTIRSKIANIEFVVWVNAEVDKAKPNLTQRLQQAFANPASISRFGGLCLGESRDLVNDVTLLAENYYPESLRWLVRDENGLLSLPYWVDHVGSLLTRSLRYELRESQISQPPDLSWTFVQTD